ncbi:MAG: putative rhamnosyl transferase [Pararhodobacter sp.]|nr:putative rhamnosyl transferase [Pararhodobacter sp.]
MKRLKRPARSSAGPVAGVIGLCRFSYPGLGGFQKEHVSPEAQARYLYDPVRLDERFRLFEAITLPSLRAQSDQDFTFLVVIGQDFPAGRLARLRALLADMPQAVIQAHPPGRHRDVMAAAIASVRRDDAPFSLQFRLDDDDGIGRRFVARLRQTLRDAAPIFERHQRVAIDFNRGHVLRASAEGIRARPVERAYWAPGLALAFRADCPQTVMNFQHRDVWKHMPTITLPTPDMFIRGLNDHNDSAVQIDTPLPLLDSRQEAAFFDAYGVRAEQVRRIYALAEEEAKSTSQSPSG